MLILERLSRFEGNRLLELNEPARQSHSKPYCGCSCKRPSSEPATPKLLAPMDLTTTKAPSHSLPSHRRPPSQTTPPHPQMPITVPHPIIPTQPPLQLTEPLHHNPRTNPTNIHLNPHARKPSIRLNIRRNMHNFQMKGRVLLREKSARSHIFFESE